MYTHMWIFMIVLEIAQHQLGMGLGSSPKLNCASLRTKLINLSGDNNTISPTNSSNNSRKEGEDKGEGSER